MTTDTRRDADLLLLLQGPQTRTHLTEMYGTQVVKGALGYGTWVEVAGVVSHRDWVRLADRRAVANKLREVLELLPLTGTPRDNQIRESVTTALAKCNHLGRPAT